VNRYRLLSMLFYGAAALVGAALMAIWSITAVLAVALPLVVAAAVDRFMNGAAEPDERMRSFVVYALGAVGGLILILLFGSSLGSWTFVAPLVGFGVAGLFERFVPPAGYQPRDPHRYGESPPVTSR
jgi:hypothetical protein